MWEQSDRPVFHSTNELHCIQPMPSNNAIKSQMINLSLIILPLFINSVQKGRREPHQLHDLQQQYGHAPKSSKLHQIG